MEKYRSQIRQTDDREMTERPGRGGVSEGEGGGEIFQVSKTEKQKKIPVTEQGV